MTHNTKLISETWSKKPLTDHWTAFWVGEATGVPWAVDAWAQAPEPHCSDRSAPFVSEFRQQMALASRHNPPNFLQCIIRVFLACGRRKIWNRIEWIEGFHFQSHLSKTFHGGTFRNTIPKSKLFVVETTLTRINSWIGVPAHKKCIQTIRPPENPKMLNKNAHPLIMDLSKETTDRRSNPARPETRIHLLYVAHHRN